MWKQEQPTVPNKTYLTNLKSSQHSMKEPASQLNLCTSKTKEVDLDPPSTYNLSSDNYLKSKNRTNENEDNEMAQINGSNFGESAGEVMTYNETEKFIKYKNNLYKYNEMITTSSKTYCSMNIRAVGLSLETIKKMDENLWDEVREMYEKLKANELVSFFELYEMVRKIITGIYGRNDFQNILSAFDDNVNKSICLISKYLLSTYHEAYIIVTETEREFQNRNSDLQLNNNHGQILKTKNVPMINQNSSDKLKLSKSANSARSSPKKTTTSGSDSTVTKRKCYACNVMNGGTKFESWINPNKNQYNLPKRAINCTKQNSPNNINLLIKKNKKFSPNSNSDNSEKIILDKNTNAFNDDTNELSSGDKLEVINASGIYYENNNKIKKKDSSATEINTMVCSEIKREHSMEILSLLKRNKQNKKKSRSNLTISVDHKTDQNRKTIKPFSQKLQEYSSSLLRNLGRCINYGLSTLKKFVPNLIIMMIFTLYRNNSTYITKAISDVTVYAKRILRDFLKGTLTLLEN